MSTMPAPPGSGDNSPLESTARLRSFFEATGQQPHSSEGPRLDVPVPTGLWPRGRAYLAIWEALSEAMQDPLHSFQEPAGVLLSDYRCFIETHRGGKPVGGLSSADSKTALDLLKEHVRVKQENVDRRCAEAEARYTDGYEDDTRL